MWQDTSFRDWRSVVIDCTTPIDAGPQGLVETLFQICEEAAEAVQGKYGEKGAQIVILSDKMAGADRVPIPSLLAVGAVHQHLLKTKQRPRAALFVDCGDGREVHDFSTLLGFGADGVCPYLAYETLARMNAEGVISARSGITFTDEELFYSYRKAAAKGILKVGAPSPPLGRSHSWHWSHSSSCCCPGHEQDGHQHVAVVQGRAGVRGRRARRGGPCPSLRTRLRIPCPDSTVTLSCLAPLLFPQVMERCFTGTASRIKGADFAAIFEDLVALHRSAYPVHTDAVPLLRNPGNFHYRNGGEAHLNTPQGMVQLQQASKLNSRDAFKAYTKVRPVPSRPVSSPNCETWHKCPSFLTSMLAPAHRNR